MGRELAGRGEAPRVMQLGDQSQRGHDVDAVEAAQRRHRSAGEAGPA